MKTNMRDLEGPLLRTKSTYIGGANRLVILDWGKTEKILADLIWTPNIAQSRCLEL